MVNRLGEGDKSNQPGRSKAIWDTHTNHSLRYRKGDAQEMGRKDGEVMSIPMYK